MAYWLLRAGHQPTLLNEHPNYDAAGTAIMRTTDRYVSIARSELAAVVYEALNGDVELLLGDTVEALAGHGEHARVGRSRGVRRGASSWSQGQTECIPMSGDSSSARSGSSRSLWA